MKTTLTKWGNSLAVRIPKLLADEINLSEGHHVDLRILRGGISIKRIVAPAYRLEDLVAGITAENRHDEILTDPPQGAELW